MVWPKSVRVSGISFLFPAAEIPCNVVSRAAGIVECDNNRALCDAQGITGYPALRYYTRGGPQTGRPIESKFNVRTHQATNGIDHDCIFTITLSQARFDKQRLVVWTVRSGQS